MPEMAGREKPQYGQDALAGIAKAVKRAEPAPKTACIPENRRQRTDTGAEPEPQGHAIAL